MPRSPHSAFFGLAAAALIGLPGLSQVTISHSDPGAAALQSRGMWRLTVENVGDATPRHWNWVAPPELTRMGARLVITDRNVAEFHAPTTLVEHTYVLQATAADASGLRGEIRIRVVPDTSSGGERSLVEHCFPEALGGPRMHPFIGNVDVHPNQAAPQPFGAAAGLAFLTDPDLGPLDRHWLVADERGIHAISMTGEAAAAPWLPKASGEGEAYGSIAVRPHGCRVREAPLVVYAVCRRGPRGGFEYRSELWAAGPGALPRRLEIGDAALIKWAPLAMDMAGNVYFTDWDRHEIRRLDPDGNVTVLAGSMGVAGHLPQDGTGRAASFNELNAMVLEPATGDLYVADLGCVRKVDPAGVVTTPLTWWIDLEFRKPGTGPVVKDTVRVEAPGLGLPRGMALHGRDLFLYDHSRNNLFAFNLDARRAVTVVPGERVMFRPTRFGPIRLFHPGTAAAEAATLGRLQAPGPLAFTPEGMCVLGMGSGLIQLDLPEGPVTGHAPSAGASAPAAPDAPGRH